MGIGRTAKGKNDEAFKGFLEIAGTPTEMKKALSTKEPNSSFKGKIQEKVQLFLDRMDAQDKADKPVQLANNANTHLKQLLETLEEGNLTNNSDLNAKLADLPTVLREIIKVAGECLKKANALPTKLESADGKKKSPKK